MSLSAYIVWFMLASIAGWLFESAYSIVRNGRWERRGVLVGPLCPIYGFGVVAGLLLFGRPGALMADFPAWAVFLVSMGGSAVLEYGVSVALERLFGAVWWDYSDLPANLNGRICLPASLLFGAAGVFIASVLAPLLNEAATRISPGAFEVIALVSVALVACDTTATVMILSDLKEKIVGIDESANGYASMRVEQAVGAVRSVSDRLNGGARKIIGRQGGLDYVVAQLSGRQLRILAQLRRFRSEGVREKVDTIRRAVQDRGEE